MNKVVVVGATGQFKVMKSIIERQGGKIVALFDDKVEESPYKDIPLHKIVAIDGWVVSEENRIERVLRKSNYCSVIAVGNPNYQFRFEMMGKLRCKGLFPLSVVHHSAIIENDVEIGIMPQIHAGVIVNSLAKIGDCCILNTGSIIEHDCVLENGVEVGPRAVICGETKIGEGTWIGAGTVIKDHLKIGKNSIVGCGSVVVKDVPDDVVIVGNPARILRKNEI